MSLEQAALRKTNERDAFRYILSIIGLMLSNKLHTYVNIYIVILRQFTCSETTSALTEFDKSSR